MTLSIAFERFGYKKSLEIYSYGKSINSQSKVASKKQQQKTVQTLSTPGI